MHRVFAVAIAVAASVVWTAPCFGAEPPRVADLRAKPLDLHNHTFVEFSRHAQNDLLTVLAWEKDAAAGPGKVVDAYLRAVERWGDALVPVRPSAHVERYWNVRDYCLRRIAALGDRARAFYDAREGAAARKLYERGLAERNPALLARVAEDYFPSSHAPRALEEAGNLLFEQGRFEEAYDSWHVLLTDFPAYVRSRPQSTAKLLLVLARLGWSSEIDHLAGVLAQDHPGLAVTLGGRSLALSPWAAGLSRRVRAQDASQPGRFAIWSGLGGDARGAALAPPVGVISPRARMADLGFAVEQPQRMHYRPDMTVARFGGGVAPTIYPGAWMGYLLVSTGYHFAAFDSETTLHPAITCIGDKVDTNAVHNKHWFADPYYALAASRDRSYAIFQIPSEGKTVRFARSDPPAQNTLVAHGAELGSVPIRYIWYRGDGTELITGTDTVLDDLEKDPFVKSLHFHGAPIVWGGRVFVGATRKTEQTAMHYLLCFDRNGRKLWHRYISQVRLPRNARNYILEGSSPAAAEGLIYYNTNAGTVAAVRPASGRLVWVVKHLIPEPARKVGDRHERYIFWWPNPLVYARGTLLVASQPSFRLLALAPRTGQQLFLKPDPEVLPNLSEFLLLAKRRKEGEDYLDYNVRSLLGVTRGMAVMATLTRLYGYDLAPGNRGEPRWSVRLRGRLAGRGTLTASQVVCPTTAGIEVYDLADGGAAPRVLPWAEVSWTEKRTDKVRTLDPVEIKARGANLIAFKSPEPGYCPHHEEGENVFLPVQDLKCDGSVTCPRCGRAVAVTFHTNICVVAGTAVLLLRAGGADEKDKDKDKSD